MVVELSHVKAMVLRRAFGVRRARDESVHEVHGHGSGNGQSGSTDRHNRCHQLNYVRLIQPLASTAVSVYCPQGQVSTRSPRRG
jgi:hypothetical protein